MGQVCSDIVRDLYLSMCVHGHTHTFTPQHTHTLWCYTHTPHIHTQWCYTHRHHTHILVLHTYTHIHWCCKHTQVLPTHLRILVLHIHTHWCTHICTHTSHIHTSTHTYMRTCTHTHQCWESNPGHRADFQSYTRTSPFLLSKNWTMRIRDQSDDPGVHG